MRGSILVSSDISSRPRTSSAWDDELQANADYIPGMQVDAAAGIIYNNWYHVGPFDKIAPVLQLIYSHRQPDSGAAAAPERYRI